MRIVQLANLYSPVSGGLRTAVDALGRGYAEAGHERVLVVPGKVFARRETDVGLVVTVPGPSVAPGYRFVLDPRPVLRVLERLRPDVIEVSDKATWRWRPAGPGGMAYGPCCSRTSGLTRYWLTGCRGRSR